MKSATHSVTIDASPETVFAFVSQPQNMPRWAVRFCRGIRRDGDRWIASTPNGDMEVVMESDARVGVVDFHWRPSAEVEAVAPARVVPNGGGTEFLLTLFQSPGMSDVDFDTGQAGLRHELNVLKELLEQST